MALIQLSRDIWLPDRALKFGAATSDRVDHGTGGATANLVTGTSLQWVLHPTSPPGGRMHQRGAGAGATVALFWSITPDRYLMDRSLNTTDASAQASTTALKHWGLLKWIFVVASWSTSVDGDNRILVGDLDNDALEASSYTQQSKGAGTTTDNSGNNQFVGNFSGANAAFPGSIASTQIFNRVLSRNEIIEYQWRQRKAPGLVHWSLCGDEGGSTAAGAVKDLSPGNANNGTITGATLVPGPACYKDVAAWDYRKAKASLPAISQSTLPALLVR